MSKFINEDTFKRGRYKGELVQDVWDDDPDYIIWVLDTDGDNLGLCDEERIFLEEISRN